MSRTPATNRVNNPESLLRHDLEDFSRDLLGLHTRFQEMFPVLANPSESAAAAAADAASASATPRRLDPVPGHVRDLANRGLSAQPPSPALTPSHLNADLTVSMDQKITQQVKAKVEQKIKDLADTQYKAVAHRVDLIYRDSIEPFQTKCLCIEEELSKIREENVKREQAEEKMREELWEAIRKMQTEIKELKKARIQESVEERVSRRKTPPTY
ncbi:hypothetical protein N0V85_006309 [Neurospora sp. IMI 360204]|nr:hypothetical protein N0V85_006309 [Neurospora sp. IMI 360204]